MDTRRSYLVGLALVALSGIASALAFPEMPARMAVHWNVAGEVDNYASRLVVLAVPPAASAGLLALFAVLPRIDPLKENFAAFRERYDAFVVLAVALVTYVHLLVLAWNLGYRFETIQAVAPAVGVLLYYLGVLSEHAERNWFVGIRTPWTLSDEEVWNRTHQRAAPLFKLAGIVAAIGTVVPAYGALLIAVPVVATVVYATAFSFFAYRRTAA